MLRLLCLFLFLISFNAEGQIVVKTDSDKNIHTSTTQPLSPQSKNKDSGYAHVEVIGNKSMLKQFQQNIEEDHKKDKRRGYIRIAFAIFLVTLLVVFFLKRLKKEA